MHEDVAVFEHRFHLRHLGDEVRREITLVELHTFDEFNGSVEALAFFNGDHAILADLVHRLGDDLADVGVLVGGAGADLGDLGRRLDVLGHVLEFIDDALDGLLNAAANLIGVGASGDVLQAFGKDRLSVDGGGGGSVAGVLGRLLGDFFHHLGTHVLVGVIEFDLLGDGDAVLGDRGSAEGFFQDHDATGRAERDLDGLGKFLNAAKHALAGINVVGDLFGSHENEFLALGEVVQWLGCFSGRRFALARLVIRCISTCRLFDLSIFPIRSRSTPRGRHRPGIRASRR